MLSLSRFGENAIREHLARQSREPFSYPEVGATKRPSPPPGYVTDHNRALLGRGSAVFERAKAALRRWEMFHLGWLELCWPSAPIAPGSTVGVLAHLPGCWSLNACRVVYTIDEEEKFGFAYGTLPDHAESGEERFSVEWHHDDDTVWYDLLAHSRPHQLLAKVGYPFARLLQKRFAADSLRAMVRAAQGAP